MESIKDYIFQHAFSYALLLLVIGFIVGIITYQLIKKVLHNTFDLDNRIIDTRLKKPFYFLSSAIVAEMFFHFLTFKGQFSLYLSKALFIFFILMISWLITRLIGLVSKLVEEKLNIKKENNLHERKILTQYAYINKIIYFLLLIVTISVILLSFDEVKQVGISLLASAGITSIIIGLAAQKTISNLLAGFQIAFTQPIRLDDVVIIDNEWGKIEEITLTYVVMKIWDERRLIIPLSYFIEKPFQNWTRTKSDLLGVVTLWVDYTLPIDNLRLELKRLVASTPLWDKKVEVLQVVETSEKSMQLRALMTAKDSPTAWDLRCFVREGLIKYIQENHPESLPKLRVKTDTN